MKVAITGDTRISREELVARSVAAGLNMMTSVSGQTSVLVTNDPGAASGKLRRAADGGVPGTARLRRARDGGCVPSGKGMTMVWLTLLAAMASTSPSDRRAPFARVGPRGVVTRARD